MKQSTSGLCKSRITVTVSYHWVVLGSALFLIMADEYYRYPEITALWYWKV